MRKISFGVALLCMTLCGSVSSVPAEVSIGIQSPDVSIGINLPLFPDLVPVPGYPVYYAPRVAANYFFYDGMYWVYLDDYWYASYWYDGPWWIVEPEVVPVFILRIPVRYYRSPPVYFRRWRQDAPPRWGEHWGRGWERHRRGWDRWNRGSVPARAPLPAYQRQYSGDRYPRQVEQQQRLRGEHYRYQPRDRGVRQRFEQQGQQRAPAPARRERQDEPRMREPENTRRSAPLEQENPAGRRSEPHQAPLQQREPALREQREQRGPAFREQREQPGTLQREQQAPRPQGQEQRFRDRERSQEPVRGQEQRQRRDEERGRERNN